MNTARSSHPEGFSLVEIVIALVILAIGLLGLASAMGYVSGQLNQANFRTDRVLAHQNAVERIRALPFDSVDDRAYAEAWTIGDYGFWWTVDQPNRNLRRLEVVSEGPALHTGGQMVPDARDTTIVSIVKEVK